MATRNNKAATFSDNGFGTRESYATLTFEVDLLGGAGHFVVLNVSINNKPFFFS